VSKKKKPKTKKQKEEVQKSEVEEQEKEPAAESEEKKPEPEEAKTPAEQEEDSDEQPIPEEEKTKPEEPKAAKPCDDKKNDFVVGLILGLIIVAIAALIVFLVDLDYLKKLEKDIAKIKQDNAQLAHISELQKRIDGLSPLAEQVKEIRDQMKGEAEKLQAKLAAIDKAFEAQSAELKKFAGKEELQTQVAAFQQRIQALETQSNDLSEAWEKFQAEYRVIFPQILERIQKLEQPKPTEEQPKQPESTEPKS